MGTPIDALVDLDRYPVLDTGGTALDSVVEAARANRVGTQDALAPGAQLLPTLNEALGFRDRALNAYYLPPGVT